MTVQPTTEDGAAVMITEVLKKFKKTSASMLADLLSFVEPYAEVLP